MFWHATKWKSFHSILLNLRKINKYNKNAKITSLHGILAKNKNERVWHHEKVIHQSNLFKSVTTCVSVWCISLWQIDMRNLRIAIEPEITIIRRMPLNKLIFDIFNITARPPIELDMFISFCQRMSVWERTKMLEGGNACAKRKLRIN